MFSVFVTVKHRMGLKDILPSKPPRLVTVLPLKTKCIEFSFAVWVVNVNISNNYLFAFLFVYPSMGDNLLLMDSPAPGLKSSGVASRHANKNLTSTQTESPCGVDKLLNFSPSKLNEVNQR